MFLSSYVFKIHEKKQFINIKKETHTECMSFSVGDPVGIRTLDLLIRSQSLYPAELPSHDEEYKPC